MSKRNEANDELRRRQKAIRLYGGLMAYDNRTEDRRITFQRCGGGRRVIKKRLWGG